jgi:hypothetical protein
MEHRRYEEMDPNLAIILAAGASILSAYLRDSKLNKWANAGICLVAFVVATAAVIWMSTGFSGSLKDDTTLFLATAIGLAGKELFALLSYLQQVQSPIAPDYGTQPLPEASQEPKIRRASRSEYDV